MMFEKAVGVDDFIDKGGHFILTNVLGTLFHFGFAVNRWCTSRPRQTYGCLAIPERPTNELSTCSGVQIRC